MIQAICIGVISVVIGVWGHWSWGLVTAAGLVLFRTWCFRP